MIAKRAYIGKPNPKITKPAAALNAYNTPSITNSIYGMFFTQFVYSVFKTSIATIINVNADEFNQNNRKATPIASRKAIATPVFCVIRPDAMGLSFFNGCFLSKSTSFISLKMYIILLVSDNAKNPINN